jgi:hypothetical protein
VLVLAWSAVRMADEYAGLAGMPFDSEVPVLGGSDFPAFYGGARLLLTDPANAYDDDAQLRAILAAKGYGPDHVEQGSPWYRYYNPPVFSLLLAPLTLLDVRAAFGIMLVINLGGFALLLRVLHKILKDRPTIFWFLAAAVSTSVPLNYALWHGQPTLFLAALFGLALLAVEKQSSARAGVYWALMIVKPHWLAITALVLPFRDRRALISFAPVLAMLMTPFLFLGPDGIADYTRLLFSRAEGDVADASFAEAVLSWPGFLRGLMGEARPVEALLMSGLSLTFFALIFRRGARSDLLPLACGLTAVLVIPHSHPQDWIVLAPGLAFLLRRRYGLELAVSSALILGLFLGLHEWAGLRDRQKAVYWPTLAAFGLLVWLFVLSELAPRRFGDMTPNDVEGVAPTNAHLEAETKPAMTS